MSRPDLGDGVVDRVEAGGRSHAVSTDGSGHCRTPLPRSAALKASSRSTYLAITCTSMLTLEPTVDVPMLVAVLVAGMIPRVKAVPSGESRTSMTVSDMP